MYPKQTPTGPQLLCGMLLWLISWGLPSCSKIEADTEAPTINGPSFSTDQDTLSLLSGDSVLLYAQFDDNIFLKNYTLQISPIDDAPFASTIDTVISKPLSGKHFDLHLAWPTFTGVHSGLHQVSLICADAIGNESQEAHKVIQIKNSIDQQKPIISLINPPVNPATVFGGSNLLLYAILSDNNQLGRIMVQLYNQNDQKLYQITPISLAGNNQYPFNTLVPIPDAQGQYRIRISVNDAVNNLSDYWLILNVL